METINSIASSAVKAIWGENNSTNTDTTTTTTTTTTISNNKNVKPGTETMNNETRGTEPISGKLGDTSIGEPFDAGNLEAGAANTNTADTTSGTKHIGSESTSTGLPSTSTTRSKHIGGAGISNDLPYHTSKHTAHTRSKNITSGLPSTTSDTTNTTHPGSKDITSGLSSTTASDSAHTASKGASTELPSTTGDTGFKAAQADILDPDAQTANPKKEAERKNVDDTGALDTSENPAKVEGAGPKPIYEVARERGGDAGHVPKESSGAGAVDDENGPGAKSMGDGTGEQYVKSSGLAADGGDFDATKPGAGREADRLLEEKGITTQSAAAAAAGKKTEESKAERSDHADKIDKLDTTAHDSPDSKKEKTSLKDKIKAKLHKN